MGMVQDLKKYRMMMIRIRTLEREKEIYSKDIERQKKLTEELNILYYHTKKIEDYLVLLKPLEREVIYKAYLDMNYNFKSFCRLSVDMCMSYTNASSIHKKALDKYKRWEVEEKNRIVG